MTPEPPLPPASGSERWRRGVISPPPTPPYDRWGTGSDLPCLCSQGGFQTPPRLLSIGSALLSCLGKVQGGSASSPTTGGRDKEEGIFPLPSPPHGRGEELPLSHAHPLRTSSPRLLQTGSTLLCYPQEDRGPLSWTLQLTATLLINFFLIFNIGLITI